ncbi:autoinducer 2 ABC transporter substrate-binding protein [Georgenia yuyongxinii]|uniref:Autoinducer 2 ABC transporter substrate-binding protein n=1 Tax=Georgenia yuyongxinii TaxID=2589797 RepID=A0A5B8C8N4_9MICO|nr:substrate-binding domain-containing protein [Georgenia yuyongxinii]QDC25745.1 autoinducer 2 ABC transporter substrate-binding protein [Georgenia yuyongxinii]
MRNKRTAGVIAAGLATLLMAACGSVNDGAAASGDKSAGGGSESSDLTMVTVVKVKGIAWFDRMDEGVVAYGERTGIDTRTEGGDDVSPEKQIQIIQDLIAQKPTAITVVPNSPQALSAVLAQAQAQGIITVAHEATGIENVDIDIEAFDNADYGVDILENLAQCMGEEGEYVQFVGGLTAKTHMEWVGAAHDYQLENYPDMTRVEEPIESTDNETAAYEKAKEILAKYPNLKGFQGSAGNDVPGIARAIEEAGLEDTVCNMGTSIPSAAAKYLETGSIDKIFFWDPALAGEAQLEIARILAEGGVIEEGTDLGIEGYTSLRKMDGYDNVFVGNAGIAADAEAAKQYAF